MPMLVHDLPFILPTLSMDQEIIIFKTTFLYINAIETVAVVSYL